MSAKTEIFNAGIIYSRAEKWNGHTNYYLRVRFYRAAWNADAPSDENSVCPSVCLSVKRVHCDKTKEK